MTSPITLNPLASTVTTLEPLDIGPPATNAPVGHRVVPAFIRADEAYYWSIPWQQDVRESMAALAAGDHEDFDSDDPSDVARWLLSVDSDDC